LEKQDKQLTSLKEWQKRAEVAEEIAKGVQAELKKRMTEYDELKDSISTINMDGQKGTKSFIH
jgi:hypothetical protein